MIMMTFKLWSVRLYTSYPRVSQWAKTTKSRTKSKSQVSAIVFLFRNKLKFMGMECRELEMTRIFSLTLFE